MKKLSVAILTLSACATLLSASMDLKTCTGCHGLNWDKKAMNASKKVSEMSKEEILNALIGYKEGTYGKHMKTLMQNQVAKYDKADLEKIADQIKK